MPDDTETTQQDTPETEPSTTQDQQSLSDAPIAVEPSKQEDTSALNASDLSSTATPADGSSTGITEDLSPAEPTTQSNETGSSQESATPAAPSAEDLSTSSTTIAPTSDIAVNAAPDADGKPSPAQPDQPEAEPAADPTPAQTDPAASAAPDVTLGGDNADAQDDTDTGMTSVSYDTNTTPSQSDPLPLAGINAPDAGAWFDGQTSSDLSTSSRQAGDVADATQHLASLGDVSAGPTDTPSSGPATEAQPEAGEAQAAKTPDHEEGQPEQDGAPQAEGEGDDQGQGGDDGQDSTSRSDAEGVPAEQAVVPPMFDGEPGEGPTHAGTDTPPALISKPCDPQTGKPLDGSMQPAGVIVGGSGALNKLTFPGDDADDQDVGSDDDSAGDDAVQQAREAINGILDQLSDAVSEIRQLLG